MDGAKGLRALMRERRFDNDGFADGLEVARGSNPKSATSMPSFTQKVAIIDIDASALATGPLSVWTNNGALHGTFKAGENVPAVENVSV